MRKPLSLVLCALALCPVSAARAAEPPVPPVSTATAENIVITTLLADGSTNAWTQADLVDALGLLNRRYRRDIETQGGRTAWHGREVSQTPCTNAAGAFVMRRVYADGFAYDEPARPPSLPPERAAKAAINSRALLATNAVSPRLAARRAATASTPVTGEAVVTATVDRVRVMERARQVCDDYGNVTNSVPDGRDEFERLADGRIECRRYDAVGNLVRTWYAARPAAQGDWRNGGRKAEGGAK